MLPCNYIHTFQGYEDDSIAPGCIADLKAQQDYLGPLNVWIYYNHEKFDQG